MKHGCSAGDDHRAAYVGSRRDDDVRAREGSAGRGNARINGIFCFVRNGVLIAVPCDEKRAENGCASDKRLAIHIYLKSNDVFQHIFAL